MGKCLIVFTRKYPYSYGEPSFQDEIPYHIPNFEKVIVLAQDINKGEPITRTPPEGVEYYNTATTSRRVGRIKDKVKCLRWAVNPTDAMKSDNTRITGKPIRRIFLWTFEERCQRLISEAVSILQRYEFTNYDEVVLYSYWLFANVRVAIGVSEYLKQKGVSNIRVVSRAHRYDLYEERNRLNYLPMREYILENINKVYVCSRNGTDYLRQGHPNFSEKIKVGYIGTLDCGVSHQMKTDIFHIVSCCRIVPVKRLERLADALSLIDFSCKWTLIGGGIEGDKYFQQVKDYIQSKIGTKVNIEIEFTGALPHDAIFEYYRNNYVDVLVNPSESEGLPAVIMEAASFGIPIIATDVGGTTEIVLDGVNGFVIQENFSNEELAAAINRMKELSDETYEMFRLKAREIWKQNFDASVNNARFAEELFYGSEKGRDTYE